MKVTALWVAGPLTLCHPSGKPPAGAGMRARIWEQKETSRENIWEKNILDQCYPVELSEKMGTFHIYAVHSHAAVEH